MFTDFTRIIFRTVEYFQNTSAICEAPSNISQFIRSHSFSLPYFLFFLFALLIVGWHRIWKKKLRFNFSKFSEILKTH